MDTEKQKKQLTNLLISAHVTVNTHYIANYLIDNNVRIQKTGTWKFGNCGFGTCNVCNFTQASVYDQDNYQRYCGHCGARMVGGK